MSDWTKEQEHAANLLAVELHRHYRAAEKALRTTDVAGERPYHQHDHGWEHCHKKDYFLRRAATVIKRFASGGVVPAGLRYLVGEHATDAADYVSDAVKKACRDAQVRAVLNAPRRFKAKTIFTQAHPGAPLGKPYVEVRGL